MRMQRTVVAVVLAVGAAACGVDSETAKRQYVAEGDRFMSERKYQEATIQYRNAVQEDANFGEARKKLAGAYVSSGDGRNALREAVRAADLLPNDVDAQLQAGSLLLLAKQYQDARARAVAALAREPRNPRALVLMGNALANLKDLDGAIEQIEQAIEEDPQLTLSYANLGAMLVAKGDRDAAEAAFKQAVTAAPKSIDARLSLANFLWSAGRVDEAERELKGAFEIDPKGVSANRALGAFYLSQNKLPEAEPYLKTFAESSGDVPSALVLADYYVRLGRGAESQALLENLRNRPAGLVPATVRLAALDFAAGRRREAYSRLDHVLKERPRNILIEEARAQFLLLEGKSRDALRVSTALVQANPRGTRSQFLYAQALEATGAFDESRQVLQELLSRDTSSVPLQVRLSTLALRQGQYKDALLYAQQVVKARPRAADAHFVYGQALLKAGDLQAAERELLAVEKVAPDSGPVQTWLGLLYEAKRDLPKARRAYERAMELQPAETGALAGLVSVDLAEQKPEAAIARIQSRLAENATDVRLLSMIGRAYLTVRDLAKAEATYRKVLELDANNSDAYTRLSAIYLSQGKLDDARRNLEDLAKQQPRPVVAETLIGTILLRQGNAAEARKRFERAVQLDSRAAVAANNLAWDYANNGGNLDVALQLAQTAKAEMPEVAEVTDTLAWIYYKKQLNSLAVTTFREAIKQNPNSPRIRYRLGLAYLQNGDKGEARAALEQSLKLNPSSAEAAETRRVLATIQG